MPGDFDDFMDTAFETALGEIGADTFTIAGVDGEFYGVISQTDGGEILAEEGGGVVAEYDATLVAALSQFGAEPKRGAHLTCKGRTYTIEKVDPDAIAYTFRLSQVVKN